MTPLERAALEYVEARKAYQAAKRARNACRCTEASLGNSHSDGVPPCWPFPDDPQCDECRKRNALHEQCKLALAKATSKSRALFRAATKHESNLSP